MKVIATSNTIIKGKKSDYYIDKKIEDELGNVIGVITNASVNKKFSRVYFDLFIDDDCPVDNTCFVDIQQDKKTKNIVFVLKELKKNKISRKRRY